MKLGGKWAALAVTLAATLGGTAYGLPLWYDGFEITEPSDGAGPNYVLGGLDGQVGGAGSFFTGPWDMAGTDNNLVVATSLTKPNQIHPSLGGAVSDEPTNGRTSHLFASPWGGFTDPEGTFYMGYLVNFGTLGTLDENPNREPHHRVVEFHNGPNEPNDDNRVLMFGYSNFVGFGNTMRLNVNGTAVELDRDPSTPAIDPLAIADDGMTHCVVMKFDMHVSDGDPMTTGDRDTISVFLDPMGTIETALPNVSLTVDDFFADRMSAVVNFVFNGGTLPVFDELRVADNSDGNGFADVACMNVPEPATLGLLGVGAIGLALFARRKRARA